MKNFNFLMLTLTLVFFSKNTYSVNLFRFGGKSKNVMAMNNSEQKGIINVAEKNNVSIKARLPENPKVALGAVSMVCATIAYVGGGAKDALEGAEFSIKGTNSILGNFEIVYKGAANNIATTTSIAGGLYTSSSTPVIPQPTTLIPTLPS